MSWRLAKKLKDTHLSPSGSFISGSTSKDSRSNSTATITQENASAPIKPSVLKVTLAEAAGLELPPGTPSEGHHRLPYALLEFDKNQVIIDAEGGTFTNPSFNYSTDFDVSGRSSDVSVTFFSRSRGGDLFLGSAKVASDAKLDYHMLSGGAGKVKLGCGAMQPKGPVTIEAFDLLKVVGKGSFGKVMQVRKRDTRRIYALKTIRKAHIVSRSEVNHTLAERTVLAQINNPFIVPLKFSFQSPEKLYLVLAFVNGGELFHHLQRESKFNVQRSRFYTAELLIALECLHSFNVIYRDLKPENILLDYTGHIALCDFGLCKLNMAEQDKTNTFCGTPEYLAPELLQGQGYTKTVDWWTLGVLLYEMLTGLPPFYDENTHEMYRKILQDPLRFPSDIDPHAKSLLVGLLNRYPSKRLGDKGAGDIKSHPFFASIDWKRLVMKKIQPPFKPSVESAIDTSNFDKEFTSEPPTDSVADDAYLSASVQNQFTGWSYQGQSQIRDGKVAAGPGSVIG